MIPVFLFIICSLFITAASAQFDSGNVLNETVIVTKDPRFDELAAKQAELNKRFFTKTPRRVNGFRIQAANTRNRDEANAVKAELLRRFPDQNSYLLYRAPNFRVRFGNFLTQRDASQLRKTISALYPDRGIYIVPDIVEYTPPQEEEVQE
jgi:hypothetical protein